MKGVWNVAVSEAYTMSIKPNTVTDMPTAGPLIAATIGLGKSINVDTNSL